jgi:protoporphyrinogen oxidase
MQCPEKSVVVLGAGISGLTAAHELAVHGYRVTLVEQSHQLGGLGTYFDWRGHSIDQFYHCQMPSDAELIQLIGDVGLAEQMYWKPTRMGFVVQGRRYAFNGPMDLLRFKPLSLLERFRFGVVSLLLRRLGQGRDLDRLRIEDWLVSLYGRPIWKKLLQPLFTSKFGPAAGDMPALYIWERLGREKNTVSRGYVRGGLKAFLDAMETKLTKLGVEIHLGAAVQSIQDRGSTIAVKLGDGKEIVTGWAISTLPLPILKKAISGTVLASKIQLPEVRYQGVVNGIFFLKRPLDNFYWAPVMGSGTEFDGVVEMTELVDPSHYGGHHVAYVMKYCDRESRLFQEPEQEIAARWKSQLLSLYPDLRLTEEDVVDVRVFKAPYVEPAYPLGYSALKPAIHDGSSRLFLATSSQVYPRITAWNSSVRLAKQVVRELIQREAAENPGVTQTLAAA